VTDSKFLRELWREGGDRLERWTNAHLDRQPAASLDGALASLARISQELARMQDPPEALRELVAQRRGQLVRLRAKADFRNHVLEWAEQGLEIVGLASRVKRKRGRRKGSAPGLAEADADVARIRRLWRAVFKMSATTPQSPSAIEIAARRHGVNSDQLENYRKNRGKR
jgi:hypothetical protein